MEVFPELTDLLDYFTRNNPRLVRQIVRLLGDPNRNGSLFSSLSHSLSIFKISLPGSQANLKATKVL